MNDRHNTIHYIELPLSHSKATRDFYGQVFNWEFQDWGPDYMSFAGAGLDGGFNRLRPAGQRGRGALVILFADDLDAKLQQVIAAGAEIAEGIFEFPGGRRFHFIDPNGSEIAVWGEAVS